MPSKKFSSLLVIIVIVSTLAAACEPALSPPMTATPAPEAFDGQNAYAYAQKQLSFGYRYPGSDGHSAMIDWLQTELQANQWQVSLYEYPYHDQIITNVVAHRDGTAPHILIGAHYDTRLHADQDKENPDKPVMGASDGASGVAVLLELSRVIPVTQSNEITLAFFDFEDQGGIDDYDWIAGSTALANDPAFNLPDKVIIVDMIGDKNLNIYMDRNSDQALSTEIWQTAQTLGYSNAFIQETKYNMLDDHVPFSKQGIPSIDIIDFDYPYWHTTQDTQENISAKSLGIVGQTLLYWLSKPIDSEDE